MANQFLFANFFATNLISSIGVGDTIIHIPPADALSLPLFGSGYYAPLFLWDGQNKPEIVYTTQNPQNGSLTVLRGQEGTSQFGWAAGTQVRSTITAGILNAALQAYNTGQVLIANYLPLTGGTLTGPLTLSGLETLATQAASRGYVLSSLGGLLPTAGGTMTGNINMAGFRVMQLPDPTTLSDQDAATKKFVVDKNTAVYKIFADRSGALVTSGTGFAYIVTSNTGYAPTIVEGTQIAVRLNATNRANATLALDGTAAVNLRLQSGVNIQPGVLAIGSICVLEYHSTPPEWLVIDVETPKAVTTTGSTTAYTLTSGLSIGGPLEDGLEVSAQIHVANTGSTTINVDGLGPVPMRPATGIEYISGSLAQYTVLVLRYNGATNEWIAKGAPPSPVLLSNLSGISNGGLSVTSVGNVLTVNLTTLAGGIPSVNSPVNIPFPDPAGTGLPQWVQVATATSVATVVGGTFGIPNNQPFRIWVTAHNNAGTVVLGLSTRSNPTAGQLFPIDSGSPQNTVGMSAGATSVGVYYTPAGVIVSGKGLTILAYLDFTSGLATAGTFNVLPNKIVLFGKDSKKPGDEVQRQFNYTGAVSNDTTIIPNDDTIPQITEGFQFMTQSITPTSVINLLEIVHHGCYEHAAGASLGVALFQDATANAIATAYNATPINSNIMIPLTWIMLAGTTSSTTFRVRAGTETGRTTFNGVDAAFPGTRRYGGSIASFLSVKEIMG